MANQISVNVVADVRNVSKGIDRVNDKLTGFQKSTRKIGGALKGMFAGAAAMAAGGAVTGFLKDTVTSASDLNETISKTNTIFGSAAPDLMKFGEAASKSLGMSKNEALTGLSTFGNFFDQIGIGVDQSAAMSKGFVTMSTDLASFNNAAPVEVMDALASATRGEYDALQRYIPTINAAAVQNAAMAATGKDNAKALTEAEKAAALYSLAQKGMGEAQGDFARTSGGMANQQRILTAQWKDAKATIGTALLPAITTLITKFNQEGIPAIKEFARWFKDNLWPVLKEIGALLNATVVPAFKALGNFLMNNTGVVAGFATAFAALYAIQKAHAAFMAVQAVGGLVKYLAQMGIVQAATKTWTAVQWVLNAALTANPIGLVIAAIAALVAIVVIAWKNSETFRKIVIGAWNAIKKAASAVWGFIKNLLSTVWGWIKTAASAYFNAYKTVIVAVWNVIKNVTSKVWNGIKSFMSSAWNGIKNVANSVWNFIKRLISGAINAVRNTIRGALSTIRSVWNSVWNGAKNLLSNVWNGIKRAVSGGVNNVLGLVRGIKGKVLGALRGAGSWLLSAGRDLMRGFINGIKNMAGGIADAALAPVRSAVSGVKNFLGISSPSRLFMELGQYVNEGLAKGLMRTVGVKRAATGMAGAVEEGFKAPKLQMNADVRGSNSGGDTFHITVNAPVGSNPAEIGRELERYIGEYRRSGGRRLA